MEVWDVLECERTSTGMSRRPKRKICTVSIHPIPEVWFYAVALRPRMV